MNACRRAEARAFSRDRDFSPREGEDDTDETTTASFEGEGKKKEEDEYTPSGRGWIGRCAWRDRCLCNGVHEMVYPPYALTKALCRRRRAPPPILPPGVTAATWVTVSPLPLTSRTAPFPQPHGVCTVCTPSVPRRRERASSVTLPILRAEGSGARSREVIRFRALRAPCIEPGVVEEEEEEEEAKKGRRGEGPGRGGRRGRYKGESPAAGSRCTQKERKRERDALHA